MKIHLRRIALSTVIAFLTLFFPTVAFAQSAEEEPQSQAYSYSINVEVPKAKTFLLFPLNKLARTKIKVSIPLDWASELYIDSTQPKPDAFEFGPEWAQNQYLTFLVPADSKQSIQIKGSILIYALNIDQLTSIKEAYETISMDEIRTYNLYVKPTLLIESDDPKIIAAAKEIRGDKTKLKDIIDATYDFVVDRIDYDYLAIDLQKEGQYFEPQSAVETLEKGSGVCIDYSRLLIALLRAQGIPARMVLGAVNIPGYDATEMPMHAWVQFFIPGEAFIDIDPTWGEDGQKYISDIDTQHIRLQFSIPGDKENFEGLNTYQIFQLNNLLPFLLAKDPFEANISFIPMNKAVDESEDVADIRELAPVFISEDDGYLNPVQNTIKYKIYCFVTNPINLLIFQTIVILIVLKKIFHRILGSRKKNQVKKK